VSRATRAGWERIRGLPWARFGAGSIAAAAGVALTFVLRALGLGMFLPELAVDFAVNVIPGGLESFFIRTMGGGAKALAVLASLAAVLAAGGLLALPYRRVQGWLGNRWLVLAAYAAGTAAATLLLAVPLLGGGIAGAATSAGWGFATFSQVLGAILYAAVLDYWLVDVAAHYPEGFHLSRRQFIAAGLGAIAAAGVAFYGLSAGVVARARLAFASVEEMFAKERTPTAEFYTVTKNVIDPEVDAGSWRLEVDGLVAVPRTYGYADLEARSAEEEFVTLECVSNEVGGDLIGNATWSGIALADLLADVGADPAADWVALTCADGYTAGIPLAKALDRRTIVALRMNGFPLTRAHGAPARIIVPGLYGMFHAKWLTRISLVQGEFLGFWQRKGWTNRGAIRTTAIIATPRPDTVVTGPTTIGGVAFAGDRGVSRVEVSTDGGATWAPATLKAPALSETAWVLWTFPFDPSEGGAYRVLVRAYDRASVPQEASAAPPFPDGSAGYDSITILVSR